MADVAILVKETLEGNPEAFGDLVRKFQGATYALALQQVGDAGAAEEVSQDAFVTAYRKLGQLKDPGRFPAWLRSITLRQCQSWRRARDRRPKPVRLSAESTAAGRSAVDPASQPEEAPFGIASLIRALPEKLRAAAVLCLEDELSPSAAARVLGVKPGTLRKRLHDARARLQRQIVEIAERELRTHLLPEDFAEKCVCRCVRAQKQPRSKEATMKPERKQKTCRCGCLEPSEKPAKRPERKAAKRKK